MESTDSGKPLAEIAVEARSAWLTADDSSRDSESAERIRADAFKRLCDVALIVGVDVPAEMPADIVAFYNRIIDRFEELTYGPVFPELKETKHAPRVEFEETAEEQKTQREQAREAEKWRKKIYGESDGGSQ